MKKNKSAEHWLSIDGDVRPDPIQLGPYASFAYSQDPGRLSFVTSRYKFCSRMLRGCGPVLEIGCGDGFGAGIVAQTVERLICTDINPDLLDDTRERMHFLDNVSFECHDFMAGPYTTPVDGIYLIDTIEHIYPEEEAGFMTNLAASLTDRGVCIIGTPNVTADRYASACSKEGHVNLKSYETLTALGKTYFHNVFFFGMNDEVIHTGFPAMAHFLWVLCVGPKRT